MATEGCDQRAPGTVMRSARGRAWLIGICAIAGCASSKTGAGPGDDSAGDDAPPDDGGPDDGDADADPRPDDAAVAVAGAIYVSVTGADSNSGTDPQNLL